MQPPVFLLRCDYLLSLAPFWRYSFQFAETLLLGRVACLYCFRFFLAIFQIRLQLRNVFLRSGDIIGQGLRNLPTFLGTVVTFLVRSSTVDWADLIMVV